VRRPPRGREYLNSHKVYPAHTAAIWACPLKRIRTLYSRQMPGDDTALDGCCRGDMTGTGAPSNARKLHSSPSARPSAPAACWKLWQSGPVLATNARSETANLFGLFPTLSVVSP